MTVRSVLRQVTVEPVLLLYYVSASIASIVDVNLILEKVCSPDYPLPLGSDCGSDVKSQTTVASINSWKSVCEYALPVVFILFGGVWSDAHGKRRKPLMILPIAGEIVTLFFATGSVFFWKWSPEVTALLEAFFRGVTGGRTCFSYGAITYIADTTFPEQRTFRMAIVTAMIFISTPLGYALGGTLRSSFGFYTTFSLCIFLNVIAMLLALFFLKEDVNEVSKEKSCGFKELLDIWKTLFRARTGSKRTILLLMVVVSPLFGGCLSGEYSVLYLYIRYRFNWNEEESGFYLAYKMSIVFFGTIVSVGIFSKLLHFSDALIGLLAASLQICAGLGNALAQSSWQMFLYPVIDLMHGSIFAVGHSIVSKTVEPLELGKVNSVLSVVDSLIPIVLLPLYNETYKATIQSYPGTFFFISASIATICWSIFLAVVCLNRKERNKVHQVIE